MAKQLLDTNIIIRFLVNDDSKKASKVEKILKDTANQNILLDTVIAEIIWVLNSYYDLNKSTIIEKISALIHVDNIECNAFLVSRALTTWDENNISYVDAYIAAVSELGNLPLYTYDKKLQKIPTITTQEP